VEGSNNKDDDIISIDDNNAEEDNVDDGDMEGGEVMYMGYLVQASQKTVVSEWVDIIS
jgi:hypothetical protein